MRIDAGLIVLFSLALGCQAQGVSSGNNKRRKLNKADTVISTEGCPIVINGGKFPEPAPLLLKPPSEGNDGYTFYLPATASGQIVIAKDATIRLACPGAGNYLDLQQRGVANNPEANAVCNGTHFNIGARTFDFRVLFCKSHPQHTARLSSSKCHNEAISIEIGFIVGQEFFKTIDICFDEATRNTLWTKFQMVPGIGGNQKNARASTFVPDTFYPKMDMNDLYTKKTQRTTIGKILGSEELGQRYVKNDNCHFMARGHMVAKADFMYTSQQRATFHYVNTAPQWQNCNNANWGTMEGNVKKLAENKSTKLDVYTGTYGVMTLPNVTNHMKEIWLHLDSNGNVAVPVPKLFWKVVYQPSTKQGIALLTVNNPYILDGSYTICQNVCNEVTWLTWKPDDVKKRKSYCCHVSDFRAIVTTMPNLDVTGLLT